MKTLRRVVGFLCLLVIFIMSLSVNEINAAQKRKINYVALGDSIAAGYGLDGYIEGKNVMVPIDSYQAQIATALNTTSVNDAVSGMTSAELVELLSSGACDKELAIADYVTISIGSNDVLGLLIQIVSRIVQVKENEDLLTAVERTFRESDVLEVLLMLDQLTNRIVDNAEIHQAAKAFSTQFETIMTLVKTKAPNAKVFVTNIYNPYVAIDDDLFPLGRYAEGYINEINEAFDADSNDYTLIDAYHLFKKGDMLNVVFELLPTLAVNFDPHPNKAGHEALANAFLSAICESITEKIPQAKIQSIESKQANQIKVKLQKQEQIDGYVIYYATKKNGEYKELKTKNQSSFSIQSKKLKTGKTYYIKVQAYAFEGELKCLGKMSQAKKIVIS